MSIECLQAVAVFQEIMEHPTPNEAFSGADKRITACFDYLTSFLARCHAAAPYLTAWLIYPLSLFDVGTIYQSVDRYCDHHERWEPFASSPSISVSRRLQYPLFFLQSDPAEASAMDAVMGASNELLAEAQMSSFRGMTRLAVLNSYGAVEMLANAVFTKTQTERLLASGVPAETAERLVEEDRQRHRTDPNFLYHRGPLESCGRSLQVEDKAKYDQLLELQKLRHQVAHAGFRPSVDQGRDAHRLCCECAQWLAGVAGLPVKPLWPPQEACVPGFSVATGDAFAMPKGELDFLRFHLGAVKPASANATDLGYCI